MLSSWWQPEEDDPICNSHSASPHQSQTGLGWGAHLDSLSAAIRVLTLDSGNLDSPHPPTPAEASPITSYYPLEPEKEGLRKGGGREEGLFLVNPQNKKLPRSSRWVSGIITKTKSGLSQLSGQVEHMRRMTSVCWQLVPNERKQLSHFSV